MGLQSVITEHGIIVSEESFYDEDKKLYGTYVGADNKKKTLFFTAWGETHYDSQNAATWLKDKIQPLKIGGIKLITNIVFEDRISIIGVYKIQFDNGYYYIGSTKNIKNRFDCHRSSLINLLLKNTLVKKAIEIGCKSGNLELLKQFDNVEECFLYEKQLINQYTNDPLFLNIRIYNLRTT